MVRSLEQTIGLDRVRLIHTNDSRSRLGSHLDRHEHIGQGGIGMEGFRRIVNHPALRDKVFILETPIDTPGDDYRNMQTIRSFRAPARRQRKGNSTPIRARQTASPGIKLPKSQARQSGKANL